MVTKELAAGGGLSRIYAIGDIHGQSDRLRAMHELIRRDLRVRPVDSAGLVHLGDYIDRGPDSAGCIAQLAGAPPIPGLPTANLMGNHERMLLDALEQPRRIGLWLENGGVATLQSWGVDPSTPSDQWRSQIPADHLRFLTGLQLSHCYRNFLFVHAGVRPGVKLTEQDPTDLLWIRHDFLDWEGTMLPDAPDLRIVHGHTPSPAPQVRWNRIGVDTNAARGGKLTCAALSEDSVYFLQV
jgi:serine/threonine protein phosphatase 1